jgi:hypothetical protein
MFCNKCGAQLGGAAFCTNCGTQAGTTPAPAVAPQPTYQQPTPPFQPGYGAARPPKSRTTAIVLAVFFSGWTWLYTYRADKNKFWLSLGLSFLLQILNVALPGIGLLGIGFWVWALVDVIQKDEGWYRSYWAKYPN